MDYLTHYLENSNSQTIAQLLKPISIKEIQIGDVFFQKETIKNHAEL
jgi:hypothetical protein